MYLSQVVLCFLLALLVAGEKKIELQDIEEDNIRSEKQNYYDESVPRAQGPTAVSDRGSAPLDFLKNGLLRYFDGQTQQPQQQRFVQQYAVTEQPERPPIVTPKPQYGPPETQQAMLGYVSNIPMQIYLVPQYYNEGNQEAAHSHSGVQITAPALAPVTTYQQAQPVQQQANYIEVPTYVTPTGKPYVQRYTSPLIYVSHAQPTLAPVQATVTPILAYQVPVAQYSTAVAASPPKGYYQNAQIPETISADELQENEINSHKQFSNPTEIPSIKPSSSHFPRYYNSRAPVREEYRTPQTELPHPSEIIVKASPSHLAHIPKTLPVYRPVTKPVYTGGSFISSSFTPRPSESYSFPFRRRPTSLLDSYIPSSVQIEYMKRGYTKDPLEAYEALSSARHLAQIPIIPRHYENGFLPNQMYHTAAGGITYGHHKRAPKGN